MVWARAQRLRSGAPGIAGHYGEFLQGTLGPGGPVVLVTLPCPIAIATARQVGAGAFSVTGAAAPRAQVGRFARALGWPLRGRFVVDLTQPLGAGAGMSTAMLLALAQAAGLQATPEALARACHRAEGASDPLMFDAPARMLWASRRGYAVETLPAPPAMEVMGGLFGPYVRTDPADDLFPDIADLIAPWVQACNMGDAAKVAGLAAQNAARTLRLRGPADDPTAQLARKLGALGWSMAHTGAARALLFAPGSIPKDADDVMRQNGLRNLVRFAVTP